MFLATELFYVFEITVNCHHSITKRQEISKIITLKVMYLKIIHSKYKVKPPILT